MGRASADRVQMARSSAGRVVYSWRIHPLMDRPGRTAVFLCLTVPFLYFLYWFFDPGVSFLGAGLLALFLSSYILPTTYQITEDGIRVRSRLHRQFKNWSEFSDWHIYPDAVYLLYGGSVVRSRILKGILVHFRENKEEVLELLAGYLPFDAGQSGPQDRLDIEDLKETGGESE